MGNEILHACTIRSLMLQEADRHVVNCVQPHPYEPLIASSGIDYNVKLWAPISDELTFDQVAAKTVNYFYIFKLIIFIITNNMSFC